MPPHQAEAEGYARSDFGENEVEVYAQSWSDSSSSTVQLPLILDRPVRFGAALAGATAGFDFSSLVSGVEATVTELDVPAGVAVDSAANALSAYHLPEPGPGAAGAASALALAALRRRRHRIGST